MWKEGSPEHTYMCVEGGCILYMKYVKYKLIYDGKVSNE